MSHADLKNTLPGEVHTVVVAALQAHKRDRVSDWEVACEVAALRGEPLPDQGSFDVSAVDMALKRFGCAS